jgi:hypothetical protein
MGIATHPERDKIVWMNTAVGIRNGLAHPREDEDIAGILKREKLLPLIEWSEEIQRQMREALKPV